VKTNEEQIMVKYLNATGIPLAAMAMVLSGLLLLPDISSAQNRGVAVMMGGEADFDACGTTGKVVGLNPNGDNFLAVRRGPAGTYQMIDKLHTGNNVNMCDQQGDWIGIVYDTGSNLDCGVSSPVATRQAYSGICKSGWVHKSYIRAVAG
jgi:hypothetical protein